MNEEYILKLITPFLSTQRELCAEDFMDLFSDLEKKEQYEIIDILIKNNIEYVDEKITCNDETIGDHEIQAEQYHGDYRHLLSLTNEQLCLMAQKGEQLAYSALVAKNEKFIYKIANRLFSEYRQDSMTIQDLVQVGIIGLLEAVNKFDISLDYKLTTYSWHWIRQKIVRSIIDEGYLIRIPVHKFDQIVKVNNYRKRNPLLSQDELIEWIITCEHECGRKMSMEDVCECIHLSERVLHTSSLNILVGEDQESELMELIPSEDESVEDTVIQMDLQEKIEQIITTLTPREKKIIMLRFGLGTDVPMTLDKVAKKYDVTRERIRQIEAKALRKLKHPRKSTLIRAFYEEE